ncbi:MAG: homoserine kinase [Anaerolineae bacterium]|nr:homoserine kinase [Anaerolineae bacterium]
MAVKAALTDDEFVRFLSLYDLGAYAQSEAIQQGTVQTNYFIQTTQGKFVFRYYENRSREGVLFESDLLAYLTEHHYPSPTQVKNTQGAYVSMYLHKPYVIFEFAEGQPIEHPSAYHWQQLVQKAAELQRLTQDFRSRYTSHRWNYDADLCRTLAHAEATRINTKSARDKFAWLEHELTTLDLPPSLPKGICHCDFHFSNVLFQGDELAALLDFDDANYTFLQFDLVGLIEYWAWPHTIDILDVAKARSVVQEYMKHRRFPLIEQQHLYDVYKLSILFDCVWYFGRGSADDFKEKRKIEALNSLGRQRFFDEFFR